MTNLTSFGNYEIIRKNIISNRVTYFVFSSRMNTIAIDNQGPGDVFYRFDSDATTGSTSGFLTQGNQIGLDLGVGSISFLGSGTSVPTIQIIGMR